MNLVNGSITRRVLAAAVLSAMLASSGCAATRSVDAYCTTFFTEGVKLRKQFTSEMNATQDDPIGGIVAALGAPQELNIFFDKLEKVSPDEIDPDVATMRDQMQKLSDQLGAQAANPFGALIQDLVFTAATNGPAKRIDAYTEKNCQSQMKKYAHS